MSIGRYDTDGKRTSEYIAWISMRQRCYNKNHRSCKNYGGRGIKVCDRWYKSSTMFLNDMGKKPTPDHSLDRINVDGNYEPSNCRWATISDQNRNMRVIGKYGVPGVYDHSSDSFRVSIMVNNKKIHVGCYRDLEEAIGARMHAENLYWF